MRWVMKFCLRRKAVSVREAREGQKTAQEQRPRRNEKIKRTRSGAGSEKRPVMWEGEGKRH